jgi:hypothetical protein
VAPEMTCAMHGCTIRTLAGSSITVPLVRRSAMLHPTFLSAHTQRPCIHALPFLAEVCVPALLLRFQLG